MQAKSAVAPTVTIFDITTSQVSHLPDAARRMTAHCKLALIYVKGPRTDSLALHYRSGSKADTTSLIDHIISAG